MILIPKKREALEKIREKVSAQEKEYKQAEIYNQKFHKRQGLAKDERDEGETYEDERKEDPRVAYKRKARERRDAMRGRSLTRGTRKNRKRIVRGGNVIEKNRKSNEVLKSDDVEKASIDNKNYKKIDGLYFKHHQHRVELLAAAERIKLRGFMGRELLKRVYTFRKDKIEKVIIAKYGNLIAKYAKKYNVPPMLIASVIASESGGNPNARPYGKNGKLLSSAKGLMQLIDGTAKKMGVRNAFNPEQKYNGGDKIFAINV